MRACVKLGTSPGAACESSAEEFEQDSHDMYDRNHHETLYNFCRIAYDSTVSVL